VVHDHGEHTLPVAGISIGASVRIRPGERIPCDGIVIEGQSYVDQALVTGESVAVRKKGGDVVYAGTLNGDGDLLIRTTRAASDTILARVLRMVESSEHRRAPSERFIDRFALYYTPAMFVLAAAISVAPPLFFGGDWIYWFYQAMMILLISCPCALVISTAVSLVAALACAARQGILIKGAAFLEEAARLRTEEVAALVEDLSEEHGSVAVVGNAVREIRTSENAVLSVAMGAAAADAEQESADIVIMSGNWRKLLFLVQHSRRAMAVVRQNVILALALKIIFLSMSLLGMATLWMAIAADTGATLLVTFNGLRLLHPRNVVTDSAN
jgi:cation transport ATPase